MKNHFAFLLIPFLALNLMSAQKLTVPVGESVRLPHIFNSDPCSVMSASSIAADKILIKNYCNAVFEKDTLESLVKSGISFLCQNKNFYFLLDYRDVDNGKWLPIRLPRAKYDSVLILEEDSPVPLFFGFSKDGTELLYLKNKELASTLISKKRGVDNIYKGGYFNSVLTGANIKQYQYLRFCSVTYPSEVFYDSLICKFNEADGKFVADSILLYPSVNLDYGVFKRGKTNYLYSFNDRNIVDSNLVLVKEVELYRSLVFSTDKYFSFHNGREWRKLDIPDIDQMDLEYFSPDIIYAKIITRRGKNYEINLLTGEYSEIDK